MTENQTPSTLEQQDLDRRRKLTNLIAIGQAVGATAFAIYFLGPWWSNAGFLLLPAVASVTAGLSCVPAFWLARRRRLTSAGYVLVVSIFLAVASAYVVVGGFRGPATFVFFWSIIVAGMLIGPWAGFVIAAIVALFHVVIAFLTLRGRFTPQLDPAAPVLNYTFIVSGTVMFFLVAFLSWLSTGSLRVALQKARHRAVDLDIQLKENEQLVAQLEGTATQLAPMAEELAATMEQMRGAAEGIAGTTSQMALGAEEQARQTENVSHSMARLADATRRIAGNVREAGAASTQTQTQVQTTDQVVGALEVKMKEIERVVALVAKIADQTNLLSLNASIEAARAGEHGAGFAVVADEVRRLADHSATSVGEIAALSQEIGSRLEEVLVAMEEAQQGAARTVALAEEVIGATDEQERAAEAVVGAMNEVASVAEESAAANEEIAASVEEQVASIGQVTSSAQTLAELVANLQHTLEGQEQGK